MYQMMVVERGECECAIRRLQKIGGGMMRGGKGGGGAGGVFQCSPNVTTLLGIW